LPKVYSLHVPEVECIGKGKAHKPYEFGCKVTVATTNARSPGGQFVVHIDALHGNPYDGHTLKAAVGGAEAWTGVTVKRIYVDKGYRGHGLDRFKVWRSGNKAPTEASRRELRRRSAIKPVIGHMKNEGRLDRNYLKGRDGDRINAILAGAGHNFHLLLKWLRLLFALILGWMMPMIAGRQPGAGGRSRPESGNLFHPYRADSFFVQPGTPCGAERCQFDNKKHVEDNITKAK
jgi:IS5 family transposase